MSEKTNKKVFGGEVASRESFEYHGEEIFLEFRERRAPIYVRYVDHVFFKNSDPKGIEPCVREVMGWPFSESPHAIMICVDRPVIPLADENAAESGLIILKQCILETHKVKIKKPFNRSRRGYAGLIRPYTKGK